jgi:uncharacterized repeat protein (TIGR01451 family)
LNECGACDVDYLMVMKGLSRLVVYALALGGALLLLCTCAEREHPKATAPDASLSAATATPTGILANATLPIPPPSSEPTSSPPTPTLTVIENGPSAADLAIQIPAPVQIVPGETAVYTLTIHNHGPGLATGIVLTDVLPSGVIPLWTQPSQPVCGRLGRYVECDAGDLQGGDTATIALDLSVGGTEAIITGTQIAGVSVDLSVPSCVLHQDDAQPQVTCGLTRLGPGAETQLQVGVEVDASLAGALVRTATVKADQVDPDLSNNSGTFTMTAESLGAQSAAEGPVAVTAVPATTELAVQADGPSSVIAGQLFTYTYAITNRGTMLASYVRFEDALPSDLTLISYAPGLPQCAQWGDTFTCSLRDLDSGETVTFTLVITGNAGQPVAIDIDPLIPGWPVCYVVKERTWLHIVQCALGNLQPGQATRVQLVLQAVGVQERTTVNSASVSAREADLTPADNTITTTITVQGQTEP